VPIDVIYKGQAIHGQRLDLVVDRHVVVEVKSVRVLSAIALPQILSYLRASHLTRGLILNFGTPRLADGIKRVSL
jgi:GxxExxY protein